MAAGCSWTWSLLGRFIQNILWTLTSVACSVFTRLHLLFFFGPPAGLYFPDSPADTQGHLTELRSQNLAEVMCTASKSRPWNHLWTSWVPEWLHGAELYLTFFGLWLACHGMSLRVWDCFLQQLSCDNTKSVKKKKKLWEFGCLVMCLISCTGKTKNAAWFPRQFSKNQWERVPLGNFHWEETHLQWNQRELVTMKIMTYSGAPVADSSECGWC